MLGLRSSEEIRLGDRFMRVDDPVSVWTVRQLVDLPRLPLHAQLECNGPFHRRVLVSTVVLRNRRLYRTVKNADLQPKPSARSMAAALARPRGWRSLFGW
jgi:hypothetical protein